jgi:lambda family phage portal protein
MRGALVSASNASPEFEPTRSGAIRSIRVRNSYEGGSMSRRTYGWHAPTVTANEGVLGNLATLRRRSRAAVRNDGYAKGGIETLTTEIVGTGVSLRSKAEDPAIRNAINALWVEWGEACDADGMLPFEGLQTLAVRGWLEGGESFTRLRPRLLSDGLPVPLQLQVLEAEQCPLTYTDWGRRIRAGVEFSPLGVKSAFWFHPSRPELDDFDQSQLRRVLSDQVVHLFDPLRAGQIRGIPQLTAALVRLFMLDKYDDASLVRQHLANLFVGFRTASAGLNDETINPLTGQPPIDATGDRPMIGLEPGIFQELAPGEEVEFSDPPDPPVTYEPFVRQQLRAAAAAAGLPYELFSGDMSAVNDRTVRVLLVKFRRKIMAWQHQIVGFKFCRTIWYAFMDAAVLAGKLPIAPAAYAANREAYAAVDWSAHGWPYINPVQDVASQKAAIRAGLTSRRAVVAEQGDSVEDIDREQADDNQRADELGLRYDSDGRQAETPNSSLNAALMEPPATGAAA